jgi:4-aminobutyrate aminotransferase-like enzyme
MPGQFMLPQPNAYRSMFRRDDGSHDWETELTHGWQMIDQSSCGSLAACIVECIQGDAGANVLPPGYLKALKSHCELRGMLLIVDEAQTGLGRTGDMFAIDREGVVPDVLTLSKPLANGLPLSAMITSSFLDAECKKKGFLFTSTHANDPLIAAVGNKTLEIIMRDSLAANARARGEQLLVGLRELQSRHQCIGDVRGRGLMAGLEIVGDRSSKANDPELAVRLAKALWDSGIWCQMTNKAFVRIGPSINCTSDQIVEGLGLLETAFSSIEQ